MPSRGKFITLEGSEGAGKSTNMDAICRLLDNRGIDFYRTREPGGTPMAEALRDIVLTKWQEPVDGLTELLTVFAARNQHVTCEIKPRLDKGQWVLCDRFTDATYAYQGHARGVPSSYVEALETWVQNDLRPDLTLYLDLDPSIGKQRISNREQDRFEVERIEFFTAVRQGYLLRAATQPSTHTIDASLPLLAVQREIAWVVNQFVDEIQID